VASIAPWLPWLKGFLPHAVLLSGKAAELYYFSILEKPAPSLLARETVFAVEKGGKAMKAFHQHLLHQGFQKRTLPPAPGLDPQSAYYREDLGYLQFQCPASPTRKNPYSEGLSASPDLFVKLLLEDPHKVELKYAGDKYSVLIPQTGRFILVNGLRMGAGKRAGAGETYRASQCLVLILYLLVLHRDLEEEALNDLVELKPPSLIRDFQQILRDNGPGTVVWEGAQKFFLDLFPGVKAVQLTSWYWKFLPKLSKVLKEQKAGD
jgi:hypothetical protein